VQSTHCPYFQEQDGTLAYFTAICPRFREARTVGHNRMRAKLTSLLAKCLGTQWLLEWQLFDETPTMPTGLNLKQRKLRTVLAACMLAAGRLPAPLQLRLCGKLATRPGAGVEISQEDWHNTGSLPSLRLSLRVTCCSSPAKTMHLRASSRGAAVICGIGWKVRVLPWVVRKWHG
jgi:hypothetical protein